MKNKIVKPITRLLILSFLSSFILSFLILSSVIFSWSVKSADIVTTPPQSMSYEPLSENTAFQIANMSYAVFETVAGFAPNIAEMVLTKSLPSKPAIDTAKLQEQNLKVKTDTVSDKTTATSQPPEGPQTPETSKTIVEKAEALMSGKKPYEIFGINDIRPIGLVGVDDKKEILFEAKQMDYTFSLPFGQALADGSILSGLKLKGNSVIAIVFKQQNKIVEVPWTEK